MSNKLQKQHEQAPLRLAPAPLDLMSFRTFREAVDVAQYLSQSTLVPPDYVGKPSNILIAMDYAVRLSIGLMPMMQGLTVIHGRPAMWGDLMLAVVLASPKCESVKESYDPETMTATCVVKRVGMPAHTVEWTPDKARLAGLWGKKGPWTSYPDVMLMRRARAWALRSKFADVLLGLQCAEEVRDYVIGGSETSSLIEPTNDIPIPKSDKYTAEGALDKGSVTHMVDAPAEPVRQEETTLQSVLRSIATAKTMDELSACKARFGELTPDERKEAIDAGVMQKQHIQESSADAAFEAAAETARETERNGADTES